MVIQYLSSSNVWKVEECIRIKIVCLPEIAEQPPNQNGGFLADK